MRPLTVIVVVACLIAVAYAHDALPPNFNSEGTYGAVAARAVPYAIAMLTEELTKKWNDKLMPEDSAVHHTRNAFGFVRDLLDMFVYAYPVVADPKNASTEVVIKLLEDLDNGWTVVGHYKDLKNKPYTKKDREERMADCVDVINKYNKHNGEMNYVKFVANPNPTKLVIRPKSELSYLYWGWSSVVPLKNNTGVQNLAVLLDGMWGVQYDDFNTILKLPDVFNATEHHEFHDFRKIGRSSFQVIGNFPGVYMTNVTTLEDLVTEAHHKMGQVNGMIIDYHFLVEAGDKKKAEEVLVKGQAMWKAAKVWFAQNSILQVFQKLQSSLAPH